MSEVPVLVSPKRWLRPDEFAEEFGIAIETQKKMRSRGDIPYSKRGGFIYYDRLKIDKWLEDAEMV